MSDNQFGSALVTPQLKKDAKISVIMGTAFIGKLQEAFQYHVFGHDAEVQALMEKNGKYDNLTGWESTAITFLTLMQEIMKIAEKEGQLDYVKLEDSIPDELKA